MHVFSCTGQHAAVVGWVGMRVDRECESCRCAPPIAALQCVGRNPTSRRVEQYWSQHAGRGGGGLGYEQFKVIMGRERPTSRDDLMRAFARLDRNGDGYITAEELMKVVTKVGVVWFIVHVWLVQVWAAAEARQLVCSAEHYRTMQCVQR